MRMSVPHVHSCVVALSKLITGLATRADFGSIKEVFASLCLFASEGHVEFVDSDDGLRANDVQFPPDSDDARALQESMRWHRIAALGVDWSAEPEELFQLARLLSDRTESGQTVDDPFDSRAHRSGCWHVAVRLRENAEPLPDLSLFTENEAARPAGALADSSQSMAKALELSETIVRRARDLERSGAALQLTRLLRDVLRVQDALGSADGELVDIRKVWSNTFDRIVTRDALELVALLLPTRGHSDPDVLAVLVRAGETAAAVLIRRLLAAQTLAERRVLFDTIVQVRAGFSTLVRCLNHPQWHVVRNAALLLGSMRARNVESDLARTFKHGDARVRLAVVTALSQIASVPALTLVEMAMADRDRTVRLRAFRCLHARHDYQISARSIADALDVEHSAHVQIDLLHALVDAPSANLVPKLMRFCTPGHHRRFSAEVRVALLEALVKLRPTPAEPLLRLARHDHDPKIREQAHRLVHKPRDTGLSAEALHQP
jgi:hypothetical protein